MSHSLHISGLAIIAGMLTQVAMGGEIPIKDLTDVSGDRTNRITGVGLVTGLNGTGGDTPLTRQLQMHMLERLQVITDPDLRSVLRNDTRQKTDNLSAVMVTADLPTSSQVGTTVDVTVSALDDATSLEGGELQLTALVGPDGEVYALARGRVNTGGFSQQGDAATVQKNHPTTGYAQADVEKQVADCREHQQTLQLVLRHPDYSTSTRIADAINALFPGAATTKGSAVVQVDVPGDRQANRDRFINEIQQIQVEPDAKARIVISAQTGTVVIGEKVKLSRVALTHANISIITTETPEVSQPLPGSAGETTVVPRTGVDVQEGVSPITVIEETATVGDLAQALNVLGVSPQDLGSIFRLLKASGELHAELIFK